MAWGLHSGWQGEATGKDTATPFHAEHEAAAVGEVVYRAVPLASADVKQLKRSKH